MNSKWYRKDMFRKDILLQLIKIDRQVSCMSKIISISFLFLLSTHSNAQHLNGFNANGRIINTDLLNEKIKTMMQDLGVPGMSLAIIDGNKIVFSKSYGYKKVDSYINDKTAFEGCSLSKSFLVYVVYQLVDAGKLDLDRPLYHYLEYDPLKHDKRYEKITARMILSHSSGIENWIYRNNPDTLEIIEEPGSKFVYSGEGYNYLAKVVELILKQPYEQYIKERVIDPLALESTFTSFKNSGESGLNYATGHDIYGKEVKKNFNMTPNPAAWINTSAKDYAKLLIATFNGQHLSAQSIATLSKPLVRLYKNNRFIYYGPGFEVFINPEDTLISHGGDNPGFKNFIVYSVKNKCGFVLLTNSDRGKAMACKLSELTVGLKFESRFQEDNYEQQYPGDVTTLLNVYKRFKEEYFLSEISDFKRKGILGLNSLNVLSNLLRDKNPSLSKRLLEKNLEFNPSSSLTNALLAGIYMDREEYVQAKKNILQAKEKGFELWSLDGDLKECNDDIVFREVVSDSYKRISNKNIVRIQAEDYYSKDGVFVEGMADIGKRDGVKFKNRNSWVEYKVFVSTPGRYLFNLRASSKVERSEILIESGKDLLASTSIPATQGPKNWITHQVNLNLRKGSQLLRIYNRSGEFSISWIQLNAVKLNNKFHSKY